MLLQPKKLKYEKTRKGTLKKLEYKSNDIKFGSIGIKAAESGLISARQIEAARQAMSRKIKKEGRIWVRVFPNHPVTKKPTESRMGKGKGSLDHWVCKVKAGKTLFEACGVKKNIAIAAFKTGSAKLCIKTLIFE